MRKSVRKRSIRRGGSYKKIKRSTNMRKRRLSRKKNKSRKRGYKKLKGGANNHPSVSNNLSSYAANFPNVSQNYSCLSPYMNITDKYYMYSDGGTDHYGSVNGRCSH